MIATSLAPHSNPADSASTGPALGVSPSTPAQQAIAAIVRPPQKIASVAPSQSLCAELPVSPSVAARNVSPAAVRITPIHSRRVTVKPKSLSATTVSSASPPAITDCTSEIGASASAAT